MDPRFEEEDSHPLPWAQPEVFESVPRGRLPLIKEWCGTPKPARRAAALAIGASQHARRCAQRELEERALAVPAPLYEATSALSPPPQPLALEDQQGPLALPSADTEAPDEGRRPSGRRSR